MVKRHIQKELEKLIKQFPVLVLLGPRQVGKTTLAKQLGKVQKKQTLYIDLELPSDLLKMQDAEAFLKENNNKCIIIDEIQLRPDLFTLLRALVDINRVPGRFILLGSTSPHLMKGVSESLAGRAVYKELTPIGLSEINKSVPVKKHWFRGGFPDGFTAKTDSKFNIWMDAYITSYIERDLSDLFDVNFSTATMKRLWSMLAISNGNIWNSANFARSLGISPPTVNRYLDLIEAAYLIRILPAFYVNSKKRLVKAPKIYIRDSGMLHKLVNINTYENLWGDVTIGSSWEGYVIEQIAQNKNPEIQLYYYRTHDGAEMDLVLINGNKPVSSIEIKFSNSPQLTEGNYNCIKDLKTKKNFVITPSSDKYSNKNGVVIISLRDFLNTEIKNLK